MASDRPLKIHVKSIRCAQIIFNISISQCEAIRASGNSLSNRCRKYRMIANNACHRLAYSETISGSYRPLKITDINKAYGEEKSYI